MKLRFGRRKNEELDAEIRAHLEASIRERMERGASRAQAEAAARREFGNLALVKDTTRDAWGFRWLDNLLQDLRYAARQLRRNPGFTVVAVLTLALGIGGTTAIFSVVKAVLIDPLPYGDPSRLVLLWNELGRMGANRAPGSAFELQEIRARAASFEAVGGIWAGNGTFLGEGEPEQVRVGQVTGNFFEVLGARPMLGRTIASPDEETGRPPVIVLSYGLWNRRFGADPAIVGRTVQMDGASPTVIGVMPPEFRMIFPPDSQVPAEIQAWWPFRSNIYAGPRTLYYLRYVGRLRPGVTLDQANADVKGVAAQLRAEFTEFATDKLDLHAVSLHGDAVREIRPALLALLGGVGLVLLIACVNVSNLLLARATMRRKEIALRAALGASRGRVLRQVLAESLALAAAGGGAGILLGAFAVSGLAALAPHGVLPPVPIELDATVLAFTVLVSAGAGVLFGLAPAWQTTRVDLRDALQGAGRGASGALHRRSHAALIVSEMALGFVLLAGAGLMLRTFVEVLRVDPGFRSEGALALEIDLPGRRYPGDAARINLVRQIECKLGALPGVESAGGISHLPLDDYANWAGAFAAVGMTDEERAGKMADHRSATPGYFQAVGAQLIAGRFFDRHDEEAGRRVVVIDEVVAREGWPDQDPVGKKIETATITQGAFGRGEAEVVGVIRHIQHHALTRRVRGQAYIPFSQSVRWHISLVVRTGGDPMALAPVVREAVHSLDKDLAVSKLRPMTFYLDRAQAASRFTMVLATLFGVLAMLLAAVGVYGVLAYSVNQRRREFGVRLALGAEPERIQLLVVREGMALALAGLALGAAGALAVSRSLQALLFGVTPTDPATYATAGVVLIGVALAACWVPARRASRVDPMVALRHE